jgi:hypothetical protein
MEAEEKEVALQFAREYFNSGQSTYRDSCVTTPNIYLSFIMHSEATKWLLHAEEKLQCLLSAHKTVCLLSNVSPPYQPSKLHNNPKIGKSQGWTAQDF